MSDPISPVPLVTLLGAMDSAESMSDPSERPVARAAQQQVAALGQDVELTLSAVALLESLQSAGSLAQLAGGDGRQLTAQLLSARGGYPTPGPSTPQAIPAAEGLAVLSRPRLLPDTSSPSTAQPQPPGLRSEVIIAPGAQLLAQLRVPDSERPPVILGPLAEDPERQAAATAQSLYLRYAEPLEAPPSANLAWRFLLGSLVLLMFAIVLYLVR